MQVLAPVRTIRRSALTGITTLIQQIFLRDRTHYYENFLGSDHRAVLIIKNLLRPARFLKKIAYGQVGNLSKLVSKAKPLTSPLTLSPEWQGYLETLCRDGIVIIPAVFAREADALKKRYTLNPQNFPAGDNYVRFTVDFADREVFDISTDARVLAIFANYYGGAQPYLRHLAGINCTHPLSLKSRESIGFNNFWHYDTANLTTAHVLLNDISETDSCMFYAVGSHRIHRVQLGPNDYYYSEKYVRDHFQVVPCIGPAGSLVLFDPNGLHRVDLKPGTFRSHLHLNYTPGHDILKLKVGTVAPEPIDLTQQLSKLPPAQAECLKLVL